MAKVQSSKKELWTLCILVSFFLLANIAMAAEYYEVKLLYDKGNITLDSINIKEFNKTRNLPGGYVAEIVDSKNNVLNVTFFDIPLKILYDTIDNKTGKLSGGGEITLDKQEVALLLPYFEDANALNIYDKTISKILSVDLQKYSKTDEETAAEKEQAADTTEEVNYILFAGFVFGIVLMIIVVIYYLKRRQFPQK